MLNRIGDPSQESQTGSERKLLRNLMALTPRVLTQYLYARGNSPSDSLQATTLPRKGVVLFIDLSGYTKVGESLKEQFGSSEGSEMLSRALNAYFTVLVDLATSYGADIPLFSGDAFLAAFLVEPNDEEGYMKVCQLGMSCAIMIQRSFSTHNVGNNLCLSVHMGISCGSLCYFIVGDPKRFSCDGGMRLLLMGTPILEAANGINHAGSQELAVHESIKAVSRGFTTKPCILGRSESGQSPRGTFPYSLFVSSDNILPSINQQALAFPGDHHMEFRKSIAAFLPPPALDNAELGKMRVITSVFLCFHRLSTQLESVGQQEQLKIMQALFDIVQQKLKKYGGSCNKLFVDDKGVLVLCVFGLPRFVHVDFTSRALLFAMETTSSLWRRQKVQVGVGVTTASVFVGPCGSSERFEYTILGDSVNVAARQMSHAIKILKQQNANGQFDTPGIVVCDLQTHKATAQDCRQIDFGSIELVKVHNKTYPIPVIIAKRRLKDARKANYSKVLGTAKRIISADRCTLFIINEQEQTLTGEFEDGKSFTLPKSVGIVGHVATSGYTVNISNAYEDSRFHCAVDQSTGYRTNSVLCMPIRSVSEGAIIAVAQFLNKISPENGAIIPFTANDEEFVHTFNTYISTCLEGDSLGVSPPRETCSPSSPLSPKGESVVEVTPLLECEEGLASLSDFLKGVRDTSRSRVNILDVVGDSGCGKTSLLQHALEHLQKNCVPFFFIAEGSRRARPLSAICEALQKIVDRYYVTGSLLSSLGMSKDDITLIGCLVEAPHIPSGQITYENSQNLSHLVLMLLTKILGDFFVVIADGLDAMDAMSADFVLHAATNHFPVVVARRPYDCIILPPWMNNTAKRKSFMGKRHSILLSNTPRDSGANSSDNETERMSRIISKERLDNVVTRWRDLLNGPRAQIFLKPVGKCSFHTTFCEILKANEVEDEIVTALYLKCEGNLGLACESLRSLHKTKQIEVSAVGIAQSTQYLDLCQVLDDMPSVQASLIRSLDSLDTRFVDVLNVASVLGTVFSDDLLKKACTTHHTTSHTDADTINSYLQTLINLNILEPHTAGAGKQRKSISVHLKSASKSYKFVRPLLCNVLYNQLLSSEKVSLHRLVGDCLASEPNVEPWIVAYHFVRGHGVHKAIDLLHESACKANEAKDSLKCQQYVQEVMALSQRNAIPLKDDMLRVHATFTFTLMEENKIKGGQQSSEPALRGHLAAARRYLEAHNEDATAEEASLACSIMDTMEEDLPKDLQRDGAWAYSFTGQRQLRISGGSRDGGAKCLAHALMLCFDQPDIIAEIDAFLLSSVVSEKEESVLMIIANGAISLGNHLQKRQILDRAVQVFRMVVRLNKSRPPLERLGYLQKTAALARQCGELHACRQLLAEALEVASSVAPGEADIGGLTTQLHRVDALIASELFAISKTVSLDEKDARRTLEVEMWVQKLHLLQEGEALGRNAIEEEVQYHLTFVGKPMADTDYLLLGTASLWLKSLGNMIEHESSVGILNSDGQSIGQLFVEVNPLDKNNEEGPWDDDRADLDPFVEDPQQLLNKKIGCIVKITKATFEFNAKTALENVGDEGYPTGSVFTAADGTQSMILPDVDPDCKYSKEEITAYAQWLGINLETESHLLSFAEQCLKAPLPKGWKRCQNHKQVSYYFNFKTGQSAWDHPSDQEFKSELRRRRDGIAIGNDSVASQVLTQRHFKYCDTFVRYRINKFSRDNAVGSSGQAKSNIVSHTTEEEFTETTKNPACTVEPKYNSFVKHSITVTPDVLKLLLNGHADFQVYGKVTGNFSYLEGAARARLEVRADLELKSIVFAFFRSLINEATVFLTYYDLYRKEIERLQEYEFAQIKSKINYKALLFWGEAFSRGSLLRNHLDETVILMETHKTLTFLVAEQYFLHGNSNIFRSEVKSCEAIDRNAIHLEWKDLCHQEAERALMRREEGKKLLELALEEHIRLEAVERDDILGTYASDDAFLSERCHVLLGDACLTELMLTFEHYREAGRALMRQEEGKKLLELALEEHIRLEAVERDDILGSYASDDAFLSERCHVLLGDACLTESLLTLEHLCGASLGTTLLVGGEASSRQSMQKECFHDLVALLEGHTEALRGCLLTEHSTLLLRSVSTWENLGRNLFERVCMLERTEIMQKVPEFYGHALLRTALVHSEHLNRCFLQALNSDLRLEYLRRLHENTRNAMHIIMNKDFTKSLLSVSRRQRGLWFDEVAGALNLFRNSMLYEAIGKTSDLESGARNQILEAQFKDLGRIYMDQPVSFMHSLHEEATQSLCAMYRCSIQRSELIERRPFVIMAEMIARKRLWNWQISYVGGLLLQSARRQAVLIQSQEDVQRNALMEFHHTEVVALGADVFYLQERQARNDVLLAMLVERKRILVKSAVAVMQREWLDAERWWLDKYKRMMHTRPKTLNPHFQSSAEDVSVTPHRFSKRMLQPIVTKEEELMETKVRLESAITELQKQMREVKTGSLERLKKQKDKLMREASVLRQSDEATLEARLQEKDAEWATLLRKKHEMDETIRANGKRLMTGEQALQNLQTSINTHKKELEVKSFEIQKLEVDCEQAVKHKGVVAALVERMDTQGPGVRVSPVSSDTEEEMVPLDHKVLAKKEAALRKKFHRLGIALASLQEKAKTMRHTYQAAVAANQNQKTDEQSEIVRLKSTIQQAELKLQELTRQHKEQLVARSVEKVREFPRMTDPVSNTHPIRFPLPRHVKPLPKPSPQK